MREEVLQVWEEYGNIKMKSTAVVLISSSTF